MLSDICYVFRYYNVRTKLVKRATLLFNKSRLVARSSAIMPSRSAFTQELRTLKSNRLLMAKQEDYWIPYAEQATLLSVIEIVKYK